jgi:hypothetical protein
MKYDCNSTACSSDNRQLFEDNFNFLPEMFYNGIEKVVERLMDSENLAPMTDPIRLTSLILNNVTSISEKKEHLIADFYKYQYHRDFFANYIPASFKSSWIFKVPFFLLCFFAIKRFFFNFCLFLYF